MSLANKNANTKTEQPELSELSDKHLADISGGATEELKGAYNFLLEVAGVTENHNVRLLLSRDE